jgi:hypothetical protein
MSATINYEDLIRKTTKGEWAVTVRYTFMNHRLVRQGGESYLDFRTATNYYKTRKVAVTVIADCVARGFTVQGNGLHLDQTGN